MSVLVVYESMYGNTRTVAEAIARGLTEAGVPADVLSVAEAREREIQVDDVLVVGAPTHAHGLSREASRKSAAEKIPEGLELEPGVDGPGMREWLESLPGGTRGAAAFDTRVKAPALVTGRSSRAIGKALRKHGHELLLEPESFLVDRENRLLPDEEQRAQAWGAELARKF